MNRTRPPEREGSRTIFPPVSTHHRRPLDRPASPFLGHVSEKPIARRADRFSFSPYYACRDIGWLQKLVDDPIHRTDLPYSGFPFSSGNG